MEKNLRRLLFFIKNKEGRFGLVKVVIKLQREKFTQCRPEVSRARSSNASVRICGKACSVVDV